MIHSKVIRKCKSKFVNTFPYTYIKKTKDTEFNSLMCYGERLMIWFSILCRRGSREALDKYNKGARAIFFEATLRQWQQQRQWQRRRWRHQRVPTRGNV